MNTTKISHSVFCAIAKIPTTVLANTKSLFCRIKSIVRTRNNLD